VLRSANCPKRSQTVPGCGQSVKRAAYGYEPTREAAMAAFANRLAALVNRIVRPQENVIAMERKNPG
jgi:hypothetical protein